MSKIYYVYILASRSRVLYEEYAQIQEAIASEKQIKSWLRAKKIALVEAINPEWQDLSAGWFQAG